MDRINDKIYSSAILNIAATTQVKYNRKSEYLLASAHDKDVKIWDIRVRVG